MAKRIAETLGGSKVLGGMPPTQTGLLSRIRAGLPYKSFVALSSAFDVDSKEMVAILGIPPRTLARRRMENQFRGDESDRLFRFARIAALAEDVLGDREKASRWLHSSIRAINNETPLRHLDTDLGAREVEGLLLRIAHGVYS